MFSGCYTGVARSRPASPRNRPAIPGAAPWLLKGATRTERCSAPTDTDVPLIRSHRFAAAKFDGATMENTILAGRSAGSAARRVSGSRSAMKGASGTAPIAMPDHDGPLAGPSTVVAAPCPLPTAQARERHLAARYRHSPAGTATKKRTPGTRERARGHNKVPGSCDPGYPLREEKRARTLCLSCSGRPGHLGEVPSGHRPSCCQTRTRRPVVRTALRRPSSPPPQHFVERSLQWAEPRRQVRRELA